MIEATIAVGLDLVHVGEITSSVRSFGSRFLGRVYTAGELRYCLLDEATAPARLAARFAAKEAVRKILGIGDDAVGWQCIEVVRSPEGSCAILLHDEALALARAGGLSNFSLSMTHEGEYASAVVVAERRRGHTARLRARSPLRVPGRVRR
jgi:holo-[acyl-carrier protein] synthase